MEQILTRDDVSKIALRGSLILGSPARVELVGGSTGFAGRSSQDLRDAGARIWLGECLSGARVRIRQVRERRRRPRPYVIDTLHGLILRQGLRHGVLCQEQGEGQDDRAYGSQICLLGGDAGG
ncbi:hypothetical protein ASF24_22570 [Methylobacterium sp. Leaf86]|nr:hypothetical protein ASF24_22570 [Methylobacterium sp. Leaf86]